MEIVLPVITALSCAASFYLMLRDFDNQKEAAIAAGEENAAAAVFPKSAKIYSAVSIVITVLIAAFFTKMYPNNSPWVNVKRMILLSLLWPIAYIDFKTLRIPNLFVIYGLICRGIILVFEIFLGNTLVWGGLLSEAVAAGALLLASILCALVVRNGIGFGDMKLFVVMGLLLGLDHRMVISILPKSVTTAIGVVLSEMSGGIGAVTTVAIIITGNFANMMGVTFCRIFRITHPVAQGAAFGTAGHVVATAKARELSELTGAVSSLSLVVAGLITSVVMPMVTAFL
jgi:Flp pilus assembly protein protease CpaA